MHNNGNARGSDTPQIYVLQRFSSVVQPIKQLVGFDRVFVDPGESQDVAIDLDPSRFLITLNRQFEFELEQGWVTRLRISCHFPLNLRQFLYFCIV